MYLIATLCVLTSLVAANPMTQESYKLPPEKVRLAQKQAIPCAEKHNVDKGIFQRVLDGTLPHDDPTKNFLYCFGKAINVIEEDGHILVDRMSSLLGNHHLIEEFKESLRECNKITKENALDTLIEMNSCINNNAPVIFTT